MCDQADNQTSDHHYVWNPAVTHIAQKSDSQQDQQCADQWLVGKRL
jgi:hypothetical protein